MSDGHVWYCHLGGVGSASRWVRLSSTYVPLDAPARVYDSRPGKAPAAVVKGRILHGQERVVDATNADTIPTGVSAAMVNLTVAETGAPGWLSLRRNGVAWGGTSTINWTGAGQTLANGSAVGCDAAGAVRVRCAGDTHFLLDVVGYWL
jgi:hypothetical protein